MTTQPILSVLMAGLESRPWQRMYDTLVGQASVYGSCPIVEILTDVDNGEATSGVKRNRLTQRSTGHYIAFVDDDDELAPNYLVSMVQGCLSGADVVSFKLAYHAHPPRRNEVWQFGLYPNMRYPHGLMCVNHLCAWRRELATMVSWCPRLGYADDQLWFQPLYHSGLVQTNYQINEVLYHYQYNPKVTMNQRSERVRFSREYVGKGLPCYRHKGYPERLLVQDGNEPCDSGPLYVKVRDKHGLVFSELKERLEQYHTIKIG